MSARNIVVWEEGLFIKPQHFQQQIRHAEHQLSQRIRAINSQAWGFSHLEINREDLGFGKVSLLSASGIFPDGAVLGIPSETVAPPALSINDGETDQIVYLVVPSEVESVVNVTQQIDDESGARYVYDQYEARDISDQDGDFYPIKIGRLRTKLMLQREDRSAYCSLAICLIKEKRVDGTVVLDEGFIPPISDSNCSTVITHHLSSIYNRLSKRSEIVASRIGSPGQGGVADVSDFMMLQVMNRYASWLSYVTRARSPHPESIYSMLVQAVGELSAFSETRLPPDILAYDHEHPSICFERIVKAINTLLSVDRSSQAESLPIVQGQYGLHTILITDTALYQSAKFILAVKASMPIDDIRREVLQKIKISSAENISQLVKLAMPGISLVELSVAPRQLPYHAGYSYFQLDDGGQLDRTMDGSSGFGMHISGQMPDLEMEFWAIRD